MPSSFSSHIPESQLILCLIFFLRQRTSKYGTMSLAYGLFFSISRFSQRLWAYFPPQVSGQASQQRMFAIVSFLISITTHIDFAYTSTPYASIVPLFPNHAATKAQP